MEASRCVILLHYERNYGSWLNEKLYDSLQGLEIISEFTFIV